MKKTLIALMGIALISGCTGKQIIPESYNFYQYHKSEKYLEGEYLIQKEESYTKQKILIYQ